MTWLKLIRCKVPPDRRAAFDLAQRQWTELSTAPGFVGQFGGWNSREPDSAWILGLWRDRAAYDAFTRDLHDHITSRSNQAATYGQIEVSQLERLHAMPGRFADLVEVLADGQAQLVRAALCKVAPERRSHFERAQAQIWRPSMQAAPGMLGGVFARAPDPGPADEGLYLVATLWASAADHDRYAATDMPKLRRSAAAEADLVELHGGRVPLVPGWTVQRARD